MKKMMILLGCFCVYNTGFAQQEEKELTQIEQLEQQTQELQKSVKKLQRFKVSGYIQAQYQNGQKDASLKVGSPNEDKEESFNRIGIRRGRIKLSYEQGIATGVFQLDITEKGLGVKDAYLNIKAPWAKSNSLQAGVFNRPFGYEIGYSSSSRESPERSAVFQALFPDERDLGAMLTLQPSTKSYWNFLKLQAGIFAGNGIKQETDSRKDFIGHLSANKAINNNINWGLGASYYHGGVYQGTADVYKMQGDKFVLNDNAANKGKYAKRQYIGFDGQFSVASPWGKSQLRAEYLFGTQPGLKQSNKSPNSSSLPTADTYIRNFNGGYAMFVQEIGSLPLSAVFKYDWYNPNTKVSRNEVGLNGTDTADISYRNFGCGLVWNALSCVRVQAYYEIQNNEQSQNLAGYETNRKDNTFTLRLQYKF